MYTDQDNVIRYKWDDRTCTGFSLSYDNEFARQGGSRCYCVEDWNNHVVTDEWDCSSLNEALVVLKRFFDIDVSQEAHRIQGWFPKSAQ